MTSTIKTTTAKAVERMATVRNPVPPPPIPLNPQETEHYRNVMSAIPSLSHHSEVIRALAAAIAQAEHEITLASALIEAQGLVIESPHGCKPHPALAIRDAATKRLAACASRLKTLPREDDARTLQRVAISEASMRGGPATIATPVNTGPSPDWAAMARLHKP